MPRKIQPLPDDLPNPFPVRVTPKAAAEGLSVERGGDGVRRVNAPPADGKANAAVIALLAKALGVPKSALTIVAGHASRDKLVRVEEDAARR